MTDNPYRPPQAPLRNAQRPPGSIARAVAIGFLVDVGFTFVAGFLLTMIFTVILLNQGRSEKEAEQILLHLTPWAGYGLVLSIAGTLVSAVAGYVCALVANRASYLAPGILSALTTGVATLLSDNHTPKFLALTAAMTVAATLSGAWLYVGRRVPR